MATIRELQARFTASANSLRSTVQSATRDLKGLQSASDKANKAMAGGSSATAKIMSNLDNKISKLSDTHKKQVDRVNEANKSYKEMTKQYGRNSEEAKQAKANLDKQVQGYNALRNKLNETRKDYARLNIAQAQQNSVFTKTGKVIQDASGQLRTFGKGLEQAGGKMTKVITAPALAATTAVGGLVGALGFKRLVGLDTAQGQLLAFTKNAEDSERIMKQVKEASQTGMATLAENTNIATSALAAGVKEGKDLHNYIKLVGDAAVVANVPVDEMNQIFSRIQGLGKLTGMELQMIEQRMPGFTSLMAETFGVTTEALYDMVSEGAVTADMFKEVMTSRVKGAADIMADTWQGTFQNMFAYISIIGEKLLQDVFDEAKGELQSFVKFISSPAVLEKSQELGKSIGRGFSEVIRRTKEVIKWFTSLDSDTQKLIGKMAMITVALGPVLTIFGKLAIGISAIGTVIAPVLGWLGKLSGVFRATAATAGKKGMTGAIARVAPAILGLSNPIGWAIGILATLGTAFTIAWKKSETFRGFIKKIGGTLKDTFKWLSDFKDGIVGLFKDEGDVGLDILRSMGLSEDKVQFLFDITGLILEAFHKLRGGIKGIIGLFKDEGDEGIDILRSVGFSERTVQTLFDVTGKILEAFHKLRGGVLGIIDLFKGNENEARDLLKLVGFDESQIEKFDSFVTNFKEKFNQIKDTSTATFKEISNFIKSTFNDFSNWWEQDGALIVSALGTVFKFTFDIVWGSVKFAFDVIMNILETTLPIIQSLWDTFWPLIKYTVVNTWNAIKLAIGIAMDLIQGIISVVSAVIEGDWSRVWTIIKDTAVSIWNRIKSYISDSINNVKNTVSEKIQETKEKFAKKLSEMLADTIAYFLDMYNASRDKITDIKNKVVNTAGEMKDEAIKKFNGLVDGAKDMMDGVKSWIDRKAGAVKDAATDLGVGIANNAIEGFNKMIRGINKVASLIGVDDLVSEITPINKTRSAVSASGSFVRMYHKGTDHHPGGPAIVGDKGIGNSPYRQKDIQRHSEVVQLPNGKQFMFHDETLIPNLPRGSKVMNGKETNETYGSGAGFGNFIRKGINFTKNLVTSPVKTIKDTASSVKNALGDVFDYMKNPRKLVDKFIGNFDFGWELPKEALAIAQGSAYKMKDGLTTLFKDWFSKSSIADGTHILNKRLNQGFGRYSGGVKFNDGQHFGIDTDHVFEPLLSPVNGKITRRWNDFGGGLSLEVKSGDIYWWFMHLSKILKSVGDQVKIGENIATTGNSGNWTTGAHLHTQAMLGAPGNQNAVDPIPLLKKGMKGYYQGGITDGIPELAFLNEEGFKESIISWNPARKDRSEQIWNTTGQALGFVDQNELLKEVKRGNDIAQAMLNAIQKDDRGNSYLDLDRLGRLIEPYVSKEQDYQKRVKGA